MTRPEAAALALALAARDSAPWLVFRMPGWRVEVWSVIAKVDGLPPNAEIAETIGPPKAQGVLF